MCADLLKEQCTETPSYTRCTQPVSPTHHPSIGAVLTRCLALKIGKYYTIIRADPLVCGTCKKAQRNILLRV